MGIPICQCLLCRQREPNRNAALGLYTKYPVTCSASSAEPALCTSPSPSSLLWESLLLVPLKEACPPTPQPHSPCLGFPAGTGPCWCNRPPRTSSTWTRIPPPPRFLISASCSQLHAFTTPTPLQPPRHWPSPSQPLIRKAHGSWPHSRGRSDSQEARTIVDCVSFFFTLSHVFFLIFIAEQFYQFYQPISQRK